MKVNLMNLHLVNHGRNLGRLKPYMPTYVTITWLSLFQRNIDNVYNVSSHNMTNCTLLNIKTIQSVYSLNQHIFFLTMYFFIYV